jgi:erythromycin esterase
MIASVASILSDLDQREAKYAGATSRRDWQMARQEARILSQTLEFRFLNLGSRDRFMAENIRWILQFEGPDAKLVAWAHNAHVAADASDRNGSMGAWLRKMFGSDVVNFGFAFYQGSLQARDMAHASELHSFTIGPAPAGSLDALLAGAGLSIAALDLRALPNLDIS